METATLTFFIGYKRLLVQDDYGNGNWSRTLYVRMSQRAGDLSGPLRLRKPQQIRTYGAALSLQILRDNAKIANNNNNRVSQAADVAHTWLVR
jgi:hypothetical protein